MHESKPRKLIDSNGFTLVELMISVLLFSVALLGIASLATVVIKGNLISKQITTSTTLAQQKLEDYINLGYTYANSNIGTHTENYGEIKTADDNTTLYSGYKRVSIIQSGPAANTIMLTVTVFRQRDNVAASLYTIIAK